MDLTTCGKNAKVVSPAANKPIISAIVYNY